MKPNNQKEKKKIIEISEAERCVLEELVEREFMRCMWKLQKEHLKKYMKLLDNLGIKLQLHNPYDQF